MQVMYNTMSTLLNHLTKNIMSPDELIIDNGEFAGNILVHTLFKIGKTNTLFNLPQAGGDSSSDSSYNSSHSQLHDTFKGLSVPIGILHFNPPDAFMEAYNVEPFERTRRDSSSSSSSDSGDSSSSDSSSDEEEMSGHVQCISALRPKKSKGLVNDELFDRFIMLAQELNNHKQQRKSRKMRASRPDKSARKSKKRM